MLQQERHRLEQADGGQFEIGHAAQCFGDELCGFANEMGVPFVVMGHVVATWCGLVGTLHEEAAFRLFFGGEKDDKA